MIFDSPPLFFDFLPHVPVTSAIIPPFLLILLFFDFLHSPRSFDSFQGMWYYAISCTSYGEVARHVA
jgi:hypothetical protein